MKKEPHGPDAILRGRSPKPARQEIWAFLIVYNALCDLAAGVTALEGIDPDEIAFAAALRITRASLDADAPCRNCGHRPSDTGDPITTLTSNIAAHPRNRTSPRTATERRTGHTREAVYTITITESNLPKTG